MDATCKICGNPAEVAATEGAETTCAACWKRAQRRRLIFDVSEGTTPRRHAAKSMDAAAAGPPSVHEEMRMHDLRDLMRRTQESLPPPTSTDDCDAPLSVREAILLVDSIAPAAIAPESIEVDAAAPDAPTSSSPTRRRLRAVYSGLGVLVVMAGLVAAKATLSREEASAAALGPEQAALTVLAATEPEPPSADAKPAEPAPSATPKATAAPTSTPRKVPVRPAPPRPRAPVDTDVNRASAEPEAPPKVDLLEAMHAAVAAHSSPPGAAKGDCPPTPPGGSGAPPSPCARAGTRTSPLRP